MSEAIYFGGGDRAPCARRPAPNQLVLRLRTFSILTKQGLGILSHSAHRNGGFIRWLVFDDFFLIEFPNCKRLILFEPSGQRALVHKGGGEYAVGAWK